MVLPVTAGAVKVSTLLSANVDFRVQVDTPEASEAEQAVIEFFAPVSVAEKAGVTPTTKLPLASFRMMVTVEVEEPSATTGVVPEIVEKVASAVPLTKVMAILLLLRAEGELTVTVLVPETVDLRVAVTCPAESVMLLETNEVPAGTPPQVTLWLVTGLPFASLTVRVMTELAEPLAVIPEVGVAVRVEKVLATAPAETAIEGEQGLLIAPLVALR